ncbi:asparagine synthase [Tsuneonella deserti]|uniref:asparagine synthase (glutamine-hydrolyzing) n=2 Tax=Tsuneonella deserti TaxID=2035528 RepID=A0ABQ1RYE2_9SPHN|nr:asparagine synthase [Tsuneonella deserti]
MREHFVAIVPLAGRPLPAIDPSRPCPDNLLPKFEGDHFRIHGTSGLRAVVSPAGAILGLLFDRGQRRPADRLSDADWAGIAASRGRILTERYWGSYVAIVGVGDDVAIVRAPFGDLACYYHQGADALYIASDLSLLLEAARSSRRISADHVSRQIAWPDHRFRETCLADIKELRGGERLTVSEGDIRVESIWTPWPFIDPGRQLEDGIEAGRRLRDAVGLAVAARSAACRRPLLLLSGGLDSSVTAACLRAAGADFSCLNLRADDPLSDETRYARCVADTVGADLSVERLAADYVDVRRSGAAHLPYPVHRCFTQAQDAIAQQVATRLRADAVFDGGGGDNVFFASRSVSMLADCLLTAGFDRRFRSAAEALGDLAQVGMPRLVAKAMHRAWWRTRTPRHAAADQFLSPDLRRELGRTTAHEWLQPPPSALPGRAAHVGLLVPAQSMVEAVNAGAPYEAVSPLASQPVIEACLRIPSWLWLARGRDRAAARAAFQERLPAAIVDRRSKGTPTTFVAQILERNRITIRDMLLGGWLAGQGLIDTAALSRLFNDDTPAHDLSFVSLMTLVDAEAWARAQG